NRGEIAIRIMKAARSLNIKSVAIYSDDDSNSAHINIADENHSLGKGSLEETYLNIDSIINIAKLSNCEAIHPGYGFLAESYEFAKKCEENNIIFIGPSADIIKKMGDKIIARDFVKSVGVSIISGIEGDVTDILGKSSDLKFPLLVKAASGGGGKGMRVVDKKTELEPALIACSREAKNYFGNGTVFVEKYLTNPRHIEVQILGDEHSNVIHLFERECSIQRRYQKIIEESPAVILSEKTRINICNDAIKIARAANYESAGTIEFLLDENEEYYFLEMNTRVQVEHPVTETVTGVDIVAEQIKIADGQTLSYTQADIKQTGHAIECRIYAEDPENNFAPSPGKICFYHEPQNEFIRIDSSLVGANEIKSSFDPMISKVITKGENRQEAIANMLSALDDYHIHGIKTNIKFLKAILADKSFQQNEISTMYCEKMFIPKYHVTAKVENSETLIIAGVLYSLHENTNPNNIWEEIGYWRACSRISVQLNDSEYQIALVKKKADSFAITISEKVYEVEVTKSGQNIIEYVCDGSHFEFIISKNEDDQYFISNKGEVITFKRNDILKKNYKVQSDFSTGNNTVLKSTMPGKVIKILVTEGQKVNKDDELIIVESMKMENSYYAKEDTTIEKINVKVNDNVTADSELIIYGK
ncbi:Biotin carboxylase of acetyl-CoA carboxylase, partial [hydrothermal vent metagenome]